VRRLLLLLALVPGLFTTIFAQPEISTRLHREMQNRGTDEYIKAIIFLKDQVDIEALDAKLYASKATPQERAFIVITTLQEKANSTQKNLLAYFEQKKSERAVFSFQNFWVINAIAIQAKKSVFEELIKSSDISAMDLDVETYLDAPKALRSGDEPEGKESVEPGLRIINAHLLWQMGITGNGVIVMGEDTGVRHTHVAIAARWRGNFAPANQAWFDPAGGTTTPSDCDGHGTHTVGTMVGRSAAGDTVGVAPDAQWIAAKTICSGNSVSNHIAAFQWAMNPDGNAGTITDMPAAINNSWYEPSTVNECNGEFRNLFNAVEAAGIAIVFSAGNSGPNASTITMPKNINTDEVNVLAVGAIDGAQWLNGSSNPIASFSSRGPSTCGGTGSLLIKPEVSAPGVNVRSSYGSGDNSYSNLDGTSMAAPHVAGAVALLKSAFPSLTGHQIKMALYETARDLGAAGEDNNYGRGLIDVYAAYNLLASGPGYPSNPVPENGATNVPLTASPTVSWLNPEGTTKATLYFSTDMNAVATMNGSAVVKTGSLFNNYQSPAPLTFGTTYYWRVNVSDGTDSTIGGVWSFAAIPPPAPVAPTNVNAAWTGANNEVTVNWTTPTTNVHGYNITVDSSVVFMNGNTRLGKVNGTANQFITSGIPTGIHVFSVVAYDSNYASAPTSTPGTGIGIFANQYKRSVNKPIVSLQNTLDTVFVPAMEAEVVKVIVQLDTIIHTWDGDLDIYLRAPDGTEVELTTDNGSSGDNYIGTIFDDDAPTSITTGTAPFTGTFKPEQPLSNLIGKQTAGSWVLRVYDDASGDNGTLYGWTLTLITSGVIPVEMSAFNVSANGKDVNLSWSTATETNNLGFDVERSAGNGSFEKIGFVKGNGTTTESKTYTYNDANLAAGKYTYRLKQIDLNGEATYSNEVEVSVDLPTEYGMSQNYPNPFNPSTIINFALPVESKVTIKVFDAIGQEVATIVNSSLPAGNHTANFEASKYNSGLYVYSINAEGVDGKKFSKTMKMMLLK